MFISPAFAQGLGGGAGGFGAIMPLVLIFAVFYFLLIRPQQRKMKTHRAMLGSVRRGDRVVTGGGIIGRVTKVHGDAEISVEIAEGIRVRVQRGLVSQVIPKGDNSAPAPPPEPQGGGSLLGKLLGGGR